MCSCTGCLLHKVTYPSGQVGAESQLHSALQPLPPGLGLSAWRAYIFLILTAQ